MRRSRLYCLTHLIEIKHDLLVDANGIVVLGFYSGLVRCNPAWYCSCSPFWCVEWAQLRRSTINLHHGVSHQVWLKTWSSLKLCATTISFWQFSWLWYWFSFLLWCCMRMWIICSMMSGHVLSNIIVLQSLHPISSSHIILCWPEFFFWYLKSTNQQKLMKHTGEFIEKHNITSFRIQFSNNYWS